MELLTDNYFDIPDAEHMYCRVDIYQRDGLIIVVSNGETDIFSLFFVPTYMQCPMEWKGANFRLATSEEQIELWESLTTPMEKDDFLKYLLLFIADVDVDTPHPKSVRILATKSAEKSPLERHKRG